MMKLNVMLKICYDEIVCELIFCKLSLFVFPFIKVENYKELYYVNRFKKYTNLVLKMKLDCDNLRPSISMKILTFFKI